VAIAFGLDDSPELRREIKSAFEDFIDMREWNDADIAAWIRRREIDIVIDLTGLTQHNVRTIPKSVLWLSKPKSQSCRRMVTTSASCSTILRYVDSTVTMLCHLRAPALLMRAHALATVREWKKRPEHQAHSRPKSRGGCGLPVATGAVS
jgi:hypothetical protein